MIGVFSCGTFWRLFPLVGDISECCNSRALVYSAVVEPKIAQVYEGVWIQVSNSPSTLNGSHRQIGNASSWGIANDNGTSLYFCLRLDDITIFVKHYGFFLLITRRIDGNHRFPAQLLHVLTICFAISRIFRSLGFLYECLSCIFLFFGLQLLYKCIQLIGMLLNQ